LEFQANPKWNEVRNWGKKDHSKSNQPNKQKKKQEKPNTDKKKMVIIRKSVGGRTSDKNVNMWVVGGHKKIQKRRGKVSQKKKTGKKGVKTL